MSILNFQNWKENSMKTGIVIMCLRKTRYSESSVISTGKYESKIRNKDLWAYKCPYCSCFHLTHNSEIKGDVNKFKIKRKKS